jgi:hypothetical protein
VREKKKGVRKERKYEIKIFTSQKNEKNGNKIK